MSGSLNKVQLIGNITKTPEIRSTNDGTKIANFTLATNESYKNKEGVKVEKAEFHRIVIFGKIAEIVEKYTDTGSKLYIEGRLQTRKWTDKNGVDKYSTEIVLQGFGGTLTMLDGKGDAAPERKPMENAATEAFVDSLDDEIPF